MSIDKTREEILRLIARVNRGQRAAAAAAAGRPAKAAPAATAPTREPVVERRGTLETVRQQRVRQEASKAVHGIVDRLARVEERLAEVESRLERAPVPATPPMTAAGGATGGLPADCTMGGRLRDGLLTDLLQLVGTNLMSGDFCVRNASAEYHMYFEEGEIRHAAGGGQVGEEAVFGALATQAGQYYFRETDELPAERTIHAKTQFLILEALRQIDERSGAG